MGNDRKIQIGQLITEEHLEAYFDFEGVIKHLRQVVLDDPMVQGYIYQEVRDKGLSVPDMPELLDGGTEADIAKNELAILNQEVKEEEYWRAISKVYRNLLLVVVGEIEA